MKEKGFTPIIILVLIALGIASFFVYKNYTQSSSSLQPTQTSPNTTSEWKTYKDSVNTYEFQYPASWVVVPTQDKNLIEVAPEAGSPYSFTVNPDTQGVTFPIKSWAESKQAKASEPCNKGECAQGMPQYIGEKNIGGLTTFQVNSGWDTIYYLERNGKVFSIDISEVSKEAVNPEPAILDKILSTFKFSGLIKNQAIDWRTYNNSELKFSIQYPSDWWKEEYNPNVSQVDLVGDNRSVSITWSQHAGDKGNAGGCLSPCNFTADDGSYNWTLLKQTTGATDNTGFIIRARIYPDTVVNRELIDQILSTFKFTQ